MKTKLSIKLYKPFILGIFDLIKNNFQRLKITHYPSIICMSDQHIVFELKQV